MMWIILFCSYIEMATIILEWWRPQTDNLNEITWVLQQVKEELGNLENNTESNFYEKKDDGTVEYKMELVKRYLEYIKGKSYEKYLFFIRCPLGLVSHSAPAHAGTPTGSLSR